MFLLLVNETSSAFARERALRDDKKSLDEKLTKDLARNGGVIDPDDSLTLLRQFRTSVNRRSSTYELGREYLTQPRFSNRRVSSHVNQEESVLFSWMVDRQPQNERLVFKRMGLRRRDLNRSLDESLDFDSPRNSFHSSRSSGSKRDRSSGIFGLFHWFKKQKSTDSGSDLEVHSGPSSPVLPRSTSITGSVDTLFSTATANSFAFVHPQQYKPFGTANQPEIRIAVGPETNTYRNRIRERERLRYIEKNISLREKYRLYASGTLPRSVDHINDLLDEHLPESKYSTLGRKKRRAPPPPLCNNSNSENSLQAAVKQNTSDLLKQHRRALSEPVKYIKANCHVKGKRKAPQPPVYNDSFESDVLSLSTTNSNSSKRRRKKRQAPSPPLKKSTSGDEVILKIIRGATENIFTDETASNASTLDIGSSDDVVCTDTLKLERGILKQNMDKPFLEPKICPSSPVSPRPWFKRSSVNREMGNSSSKEKRKERDRRKVEDWMIESGFPRRSFLNMDNRSNFFSKSDKSDEKRKSQISILTNISELDREAAEIIRRGKEKEKSLLESHNAMFFGNNETESDSDVTVNKSSDKDVAAPKKSSAKDLITLFNAITNVTKVTVNSSFLSKDGDNFFNKNKTRKQGDETNKVINANPSCSSAVEIEKYDEITVNDKPSRKNYTIPEKDRPATSSTSSSNSEGKIARVTIEELEEFDAERNSKAQALYEANRQQRHLSPPIPTITEVSEGSAKTSPSSTIGSGKTNETVPEPAPEPTHLKQMQVWVCPRCTLENLRWRITCEACDMWRPNPFEFREKSFQNKLAADKSENKTTFIAKVTNSSHLYPNISKFNFGKKEENDLRKDSSQQNKGSPIVLGSEKNETKPSLRDSKTITVQNSNIPSTEIKVRNSEKQNLSAKNTGNVEIKDSDEVNVLEKTLEKKKVLNSENKASNYLINVQKFTTKNISNPERKPSEKVAIEIGSCAEIKPNKISTKEPSFKSQSIFNNEFKSTESSVKQKALVQKNLFLPEIKPFEKVFSETNSTQKSILTKETKNDKAENKTKERKEENTHESNEGDDQTEEVRKARIAFFEKDNDSDGNDNIKQQKITLQKDINSLTTIIKDYDEEKKKLKEMLIEMKHSLPKRPKPFKKTELKIDELKTDKSNLYSNESNVKSRVKNTVLPNSDYINIISNSNSLGENKAEAYLVESETVVEEIKLKKPTEKVSSSVQTSGLIKQICPKPKLTSGKEILIPIKVEENVIKDGILYQSVSKETRRIGTGTFELLRPRDFANIEAIKTDNKPAAIHLYANVAENQDGVIPIKTDEKVIEPMLDDIDKLSKQLTAPQGVANFKARLDMGNEKNVNTLAVNRLLKRLEVAIARGNHELAATLARELAQLKVNCSVIRQKPEIYGNEILVEMYVEDKLSHQGPFPMKLQPSLTVFQLKERIEREYEIPVGVQRWILGKQLAADDKATLEGLGVNTDGCPLFLYLVAPEKAQQKLNTEIGVFNQKTPATSTQLHVDISKKDIQEAGPSGINNLKNIKENKEIVTEKIEAVPEIETKVDLNPIGSFALGWKCEVCTLLNSPTRPGCAACTTERPKDYKVPEDYKLSEIEESRIKNETEIQEKSTKEDEEEKAKNYQKLVDLEKDDLIVCTEAFDCPVCLTDYEPNEGIVLRECLHVFCRTCIAHTIQFSEEPEVKCPFRDNNYTCDSSLLQREIKALVRPEIYEEHLAKSIALAETKIGNTFHCKTPDCKGWCIYEDNVNIFRCPVCTHTNCLTCQAIHEGLDCKQFQEQLNTHSDMNIEARRTKEMLQEMVDRGEAMNCPTCQVVLMKKWGCDWLRCSMCKTEICWVTRGPRWGPNGKGDTSGGCQCGVNGIKCHQKCTYCH